MVVNNLWTDATCSPLGKQVDVHVHTDTIVIPCDIFDVPLLKELHSKHLED